MYIVYKTTCLLNRSLFYIGVHKTKDIKCKYVGSGKLLQSAIREQGKHNFTKEVLFVFDSQEEAYLKEIELIAELRPGYNINNGGSGVGQHSNETKLKIGLSHTGLKHSNETLLKFRTRRHSEETKRRISASMSGRKLCEQHINKLRIAAMGNTHASRKENNVHTVI